MGTMLAQRGFSITLLGVAPIANLPVGACLFGATPPLFGQVAENRERVLGLIGPLPVHNPTCHAEG